VPASRKGEGKRDGVDRVLLSTLGGGKKEREESGSTVVGRPITVEGEKTTGDHPWAWPPKEKKGKPGTANCSNPFHISGGKKKALFLKLPAGWERERRKKKNSLAQVAVHLTPVDERREE